jgi:autotransporter-associated beta strand protein
MRMTPLMLPPCKICRRARAKLALACATLSSGLIGSAAHAQATNWSNLLGAANINASYYLNPNVDVLNDAQSQLDAIGSHTEKLEIDKYTLSNTWSSNAAKYAWNSNWPAFNSSTTTTTVAQMAPFTKAFSDPNITSYDITTYSMNIPNGGDGTSYWNNGISTTQEAAETTQFYNLTKYLMQTYAGTGKTFYLSNWEGDGALVDALPSGDTVPPAAEVQGMINWLNARQAGIDEARAQFASTYKNVNVFGTVEVNHVAAAMSGDVYNGVSGFATVTNDVLPYTDTDFVSYSSYDTQKATTGSQSYANAVAYVAAHLPISAANGQNTQSEYVGEYGTAENYSGAATLTSLMNNVIGTATADNMPLAFYWEIYSNELNNGYTTPPGGTGNDAPVQGFYLVKPDGTPATAWKVYRWDAVTNDPTSSTTAAVMQGLHLAYASNFTAPGATLGSAWTTNTSGGTMSVGITGGQVQIKTLNGSSIPYGQATLNLDSVLGRGLKVGEYLQFTLNRLNDTGAIGLTAFGDNHGSGTGSGSQTLNVFAAGAWNAISYNAAGSGSVPTYNFDNTTTLGVKLVAATGESATVNYYVNGVFTGSWLYQTTATTLDTLSFFAQSNTNNAAFDFNNLAVYTTDGNLAATSYQWDPGHTASGNGGGAGTWDAGTNANFYNGSGDVVWNYATLGDNVTFGGTSGTVTIAAAGVTASNLVFNTANYAVSGGTLTMMGNQAITNNTTGNVTINSVIAGTSGVNITGTGSVTLAGSNTFTGGLFVGSGSTAIFTTDANLGAAGQPVVLNNSTLSYNGTVSGGLTETRTFTIGAQGGTINIPNSGPSNGKLVINGTSLIGGVGTITKTGPGWLTVYGDNSASFTGNWIINGGALEIGGANVLGTAGSVTVNNGAEAALNLGSGSLANPFIVNTGATLSTDNHTVNSGTFSGPITANGNFNVRLGDFWSNFAEKVAISGNISGSGTLTTIAPNGTGTTNASSEVLTLTGDNSGFSGGITVPLGTVVAGLTKTNTLGTGRVTLSGGKLSLQGQLAPIGTAAAVAAATVTGFNADTMFGAPDMSSFATPTVGADGNYSFFQTGYTPQFNPTATIANAGTTLTGGITGTNITSAVNGTPFTLQPFMSNNTLQIKEGSTGSLTMPTPTAFTTLSILAMSTQANNETPNITIHFSDGTSVTTTYKAYDWSLANGTRTAASVFGSAGVNRYGPSSGWDTGAYGMYETDINMTNISGVDYSNKAISSITFTATTYDTLNRGYTDIYAISGAARAWAAGPTQAYTNNLSVTANSGIDVSGSLNATMGTLTIGNQLSVTSADTTTNPYSLTLGPTTLTGTATFDVASSSGGGAGTLSIGAISGTGAITKTDSGKLQLTGASGTVSGALTLNGGTVEVDGVTTVGSLAGNGTGTLNVPGGRLNIGARLAGHPAATALAGLSVTAGGTLDVANNDLIVHGGSLSTLTADLKSGYNAGSGYWNGTGIISSTAAGNSSKLTTLGIAQPTAATTFDTQSVSSTDVLIRYTYYGDANLDGHVDGTDYTLIDTGFGSHGTMTGWQNGDFNYDGHIDGSDYSLIDNAFNSQNAGPLAEVAQSTAILTDEIAPSNSASVPEPGNVGVMLLAAFAGLTRRRRGTRGRAAGLSAGAGK